MQTEKTVFISYRRTNIYMARAVYQNLTAHDYDCFLDFESIDAGSFERIILNQIAARAHFIVVLTPSALERCTDPNDWLRREIEYALEMKRNIVPLMFDRFDFDDVRQYLVGKMVALPQYSALNIPPDYFDEAMDRLRGRFLNKTLDVILHPTPPADQAAVLRAKANEATQPVVKEEQLTAEQWFERGYNSGEVKDYDAAITAYTEAIRLNPQYAAAYNNRGAARKAKGDLDGAISDYTEAIRLNPQYAAAYNNRGIARKANGDPDSAISDYNEAIRLNPKDNAAYNNRALARSVKGDLDGAISDYNETIRLNPQLAEAYNNRGEAYFAQKQFQKALSDFSKTNELKPGFNFALAGLAITHHAMGKINEAKRLWQLLVRIDSRYQDIEWVKQELSWIDALVEEARKLIEEL